MMVDARWQPVLNHNSVDYSSIVSMAISNHHMLNSIEFESFGSVEVSVFVRYCIRLTRWVVMVLDDLV